MARTWLRIKVDLLGGLGVDLKPAPDDWRHRCTVETEKADPLEEYGVKPSSPVPIWGWGAIPDQYGRDSLD